MNFAIVKNGVVIAINVATTAQDETWIPCDGLPAFIGGAYDGTFHPPIQPPVVPPVVHTTFGTKITQLAFMVRFTSTERKAIKAKAAIDADVDDVWDLMQAATYIELADPKIIGGLALIVSKVPELTNARSLVIRAVPVVDPLELPGSVRITYGLTEIPT